MILSGEDDDIARQVNFASAVHQHTVIGTGTHGGTSQLQVPERGPVPDKS